MPTPIWTGGSQCRGFQLIGGNSFFFMARLYHGNGEKGRGVPWVQCIYLAEANSHAPGAWPATNGGPRPPRLTR